MIRPFAPTDVPWITRTHAMLYTRDEGFDASFAPLVESVLKVFSTRHNPQREAGWMMEEAGHSVGCIFCTMHDQTTAKIRLFLLLPEMRGRGLGQSLLSHAMRFARLSGYTQLRIWTYAEHRAACRLYARTGLELISSNPTHAFGRDLTEQVWQIGW